MMHKLIGAVAAVLLFLNPLSAQKSDAFQTAMYLEHWQEAIDIQTAQCKNTPENWINWFHLADAYLAGSRPVDAKAALQNVGKYSTQASHQLIVEGRLALINEQAEAADKLFKKAAKAGRKDVVALRLLGESWLYGASRNLKNAETALLDARKRNSRDFETQMDLGYCYRALLDGGNALTHFDFAQTINPQNALPALMSAMVYKSGKVDARQLEMLDKALLLEPEFVAALQQKAELYYYQQRNFPAAATAYARLLEVDPKAPITDKMAYVNALFLTKQYDQTILWVDKIIGEDGSRNYLRRLSAYSYYETENYPKGKAIMDDYFARVDTEKIIPQDYEYYAKLLQKEDQDSSALVYFQKAIDLDPSRWDLYAEIGTIRYKLKDYLGSAEAFEHRLDSLTSRTALDYYRTGLARYMVQDSANYIKAAAYFTKVSDIVPDKPIGWLMQAKSLSKIEPDIEAHPERAAEFGRAKDAFEHYVEIAEKEEPGKETKDLISAYEYLAYCAILQNETEKVQDYLKSLQTLDPENKSIEAIDEWIKSTGSGE